MCSDSTRCWELVGRNSKRWHVYEELHEGEKGSTHHDKKVQIQRNIVPGNNYNTTNETFPYPDLVYYSPEYLYMCYRQSLYVIGTI